MSLSAPRLSSFVGRQAEMDNLRAALADCVAGRGRLALLVGDAGIGKSRLADEIAAEAGNAGATVLWGRCWEAGGAPAYWPWTLILRAAAPTPAARNAIARGVSPELARLVPALAPDASVPSVSDPEQARFALFDAIATFLRDVAEQQPLVLIIDDLHAADPASALLLLFLARQLRDRRLLILVTYRPIEAAADAALAQVVSDLIREGDKIQLHALGRDDVASYIELAAESPAPISAVEAIYSTTEGHPLFLVETVRLWLNEGSPDLAAGDSRSALPIPDELRTTLRRRLAPLSEEARQTLSAASVLGREVDVTLLAAVLADAEGTTPHAALPLAALEQGQQAGLLRPLPGSSSRYSFSHLLLRDTLYDDLPAVVRAALHGRVARAMEDVYAADLGPHFAELAHHYARSSSADAIAKTTHYATLAGARAMAALAYEEAVGHFDRALDALPWQAAEAEQRRMHRCRLLLALGDALWGSGNLGRMRVVFANAAEVADAIAEPDGAVLLAQAALGFGGRQQRAHVVFDPDVIDLLERAVARLVAGHDAWRARVLARLAYALYARSDSLPRRQQLCDEAIRLAQPLGDDLTLRWVLNDVRWALWGPDTIEDRLRISSQMVALGERLGDPEVAVAEHAWQVVDQLELGDIARVDAEVRRFAAIARELRRPWFDWYNSRFAAMRALQQGQFAEAERLANEAIASHKRVMPADAMLIYGTLILCVRTEQGRLAELEASMQALVAQYPAVPVWRYSLAFLYTEQGKRAEAAAELERIAAHDLRDLPQDYLKLPALAYLSEVCSFLGDVDRAAMLYQRFAPYAGRCVVLGYGIACRGSVQRYLGMLAAVLGRATEAAAHFDAALDVNERMNARPEIARTALAYAQLLERAGDARAAGLRARARTIAEELGMAALAARASAVATETPPFIAVSAGVPAARAFRQRGDYWTLSFSGEPFQVRGMLGLLYLAHLLRHPAQEFHVTDLVDLVGGGEARPRGGSDHAGELLDATAREQYRRRVASLREELAEAEVHNDLARAENLRNELEAIAGQLSAGLGLGGRPRVAGSAAERARVSVTKRIGVALKRIAANDAALARYLQATIKTGSFCVYTPDPDRPVVWEL